MVEKSPVGITLGETFFFRVGTSVKEHSGSVYKQLRPLS